MMKRINKLIDCAVLIKCRLCRKPLIKVDPKRLASCKWSEIVDADLRAEPSRPSDKMAPSIGLLCEKCTTEERVAPPLNFHLFSIEQMERFERILSKMMNVDGVIPLGRENVGAAGMIERIEWLCNLLCQRTLK